MPRLLEKTTIGFHGEHEQYGRQPDTWLANQLYRPCPICGISYVGEEKGITIYRCSECGESIASGIQYRDNQWLKLHNIANYCPWCGVKFEKD